MENNTSFDAKRRVSDLNLSYRDQKAGAYGLAGMCLVGTALVPTGILTILLGAVSAMSAGFAASLSINAARILSDTSALKAKKDAFEKSLIAANRIKQELVDLKLTHQNEIRLLNENFEKRLAHAKDGFEKQYQNALDNDKYRIEKEFSDKTTQLEADYLRKTKDYRSVQVARLAYVIREKEQLEDYLTEEWYKEVGEYKGFFQEFQEVMAGFETQLEVAKTDFNSSFNAKTQEVAALHQTIQKNNNPKPFTGSDKASIVGNKLLDFFLNQGITLDAEKCETKLDSSIIWVRPRGTTIAALLSHAEAIHLYFELVDKPSITADSGCVKIVLQDATVKTPSVIAEPSIDRFKDALQASNHIRLTAPTDSGKSVLLDNILGVYDELFDGKQSLTLLDPKYPFTDWNGHQPDYKGFDECLGAMNLLQVKIDKRLEEAKRLADEGKVIPEYEPELFAIDELELLYADAMTADGEKKGDITKALIKSINTGLKLGRGLTKTKGRGIKVLYVTQSPLCSKIGMNKDAFDQSTSIYLGSNIPLVLQDKGELDGKITTVKRKALEKEYSVRVAANQKYLMLVRLPNGGDVFLMKAPKPGTFIPVLKPNEKGVSTSETVDMTEIVIPPKETISACFAISACKCTKCGVMSTETNGFYKVKGKPDRPRFKCLNPKCKAKSFTSPKVS